MGIKNFFKKIGNGIRNAGRWIKDKALPVIGRIAQPILNVMGMIPGKLGMIGKVGSVVTSALQNITNQIPNKDVRDKINNVIDKGNNTFQGAIDKGKNIVDTGQNIVNATKEGWNNIKSSIKPAVMPKVLKPI